MILWLSHIGVTVGDIDRSLSFYTGQLGFPVLSDAERRGEYVEKITGIPGFHTRTVYLSVTTHAHLELFGFFFPKAVPAKEPFDRTPGIKAFFLNADDTLCLSRPIELGLHKTAEPGGSRTKEIVTDKCRLMACTDPDGLRFGVVSDATRNTPTPGKSEKGFVYSVLWVKDLESSLAFYRDILGLGVLHTEASSRFHGEGGGQSEDPEPTYRWATLGSRYGVCLKLVQALEPEVFQEHVWLMERIGYTHLAFAVRDMETYFTNLEEVGVKFKSEPKQLKAGPHIEGICVYIDSPDGVVLELIDSPLIRSATGIE